MEVDHDAGAGPPAAPKWIVMPGGVVNASPSFPSLGGCGTITTSKVAWSYWFTVDKSGYGGLVIPKGTRLQAVWQVADFSPYDGPGCQSQTYIDRFTFSFAMP
jgi:hypothetical protein